MSASDHLFLAMWDCHGLEYLVDITEDEQRVTWERLKGNDTVRHAYANPQHLILRARYNSQRHYEIYTFSAQAGITADDLKKMFNDNPQVAADTIRKVGHCIYSDRVKEDQIVIR